MKQFALLLTSAALALTFSSCHLGEKYSKNNSAGQAWLDQNTKGPVKKQFEGTYYSPEWGVAVIDQKGKNLVGQLGRYQVRGKVGGNTAYLLLEDFGWVYYTAILKRVGWENLNGTYSEYVPYSDKGAEPLKLERID